ncbi:hypothetical protein ACVWXO_005371 [Bradyrhizobium sp. LM2.7]
MAWLRLGQWGQTMKPLIWMIAAMRLLSAEEKSAINESLNATDDVGVSLLSSRLGITEQLAREWKTEGRVWPAAEALAKGFVHAIDGAA